MNQSITWYMLLIYTYSISVSQLKIRWLYSSAKGQVCLAQKLSRSMRFNKRLRSSWSGFNESCNKAICTHEADSDAFTKHCLYIIIILTSFNISGLLVFMTSLLNFTLWLSEMSFTIYSAMCWARSVSTCSQPWCTSMQQCIRLTPNERKSPTYST